MLKKRVVAAVAAALVAGGVSAVEVNPGGKGEVLLAPMVMVAGGWESELRIINTDTVNSVVAKVAFHKAERSEEVLDFLVFLSPGDVWRGTAVKNADGTFGVRSTDESSLVVPVAGAVGCPAATAQSVGFDPMVIKSSVPADFTYVKVFQSRLVTGLGAAPVAKSAILTAYSTACNAGTPITAADTANVLTADVTLSNAANGNMLRLPMTALANYNNSAYQRIGFPSTFAGNPTNADALGTTTKARVEDALWATDFAVPYDVTSGSTTFATVTFPTKETFISSAGTQYAGFLPGGRAPNVAMQIRNEQEDLIGTAGCIVSPCAVNPANTLPNELNVLAVTGGSGTNTASQVFTSTFTRGWVNMSIEPSASTARGEANYNNFGTAGAPALVTVINWVTRGTSLQGSWTYAAKTQAPDNN